MTDTGHSIDDLIDAVPWSRLTHACDVALDAPPRLRDLAADVDRGTSEDIDALDEWVLSTVVHQGTPSSATAPRAVDRAPDPRGRVDTPALASCLLAVADVATALRRIAENGTDPHGDQPSRMTC